jgi:hypothetical protein
MTMTRDIGGGVPLRRRAASAPVRITFDCIVGKAASVVRESLGLVYLVAGFGCGPARPFRSALLGQATEIPPNANALRAHHKLTFAGRPCPTRHTERCELIASFIPPTTAFRPVADVLWR